MNRERQAELKAKLRGLDEWSQYEVFLKRYLDMNHHRAVAYDLAWEAYKKSEGGDVAIATQERMTIEEFSALVADNDEGSILKSALWVAKHLNTPYFDIDVETTPGPTAANLLCYAKANEREFWANVWARFLPSRSEVDSVQKYKDTGQNIDDLEDTLLRMNANVNEAKEKVA